MYEYSFADGISDRIITDFKTIYYEKNMNIPINQKLVEKLNGKTKNEKQSIYFKTICNFLINVIKSQNLKYILVYCANQTKAATMKEYVQNFVHDDNVVVDDTNSKKENCGLILNESKFNCWTGSIKNVQR